MLGDLMKQPSIAEVAGILFHENIGSVKLVVLVFRPLKE